MMKLILTKACKILASCKVFNNMLHDIKVSTSILKQLFFVLSYKSSINVIDFNITKQSWKEKLRINMRDFLILNLFLSIWRIANNFVTRYYVNNDVILIWRIIILFVKYCINEDIYIFCDLHRSRDWFTNLVFGPVHYHITPLSY